jgi:four helix bundle protein
MTMQNSKFDDLKERFKQRLYNFTLKLIEFLDTLPKDNLSRRIGGQLLRGGRSIPGNYIEGQSAGSKKEISNIFASSILTLKGKK